METVQLPVAQRAKTALAVTPEYEKKLQELAGKHRNIVSITNEAGLADCHSARMELKNTRLAIEKKGKVAREDAQAFAKAVIGEEKRLVAMIAPEEQRLQKLQDDWDAAREAEHQAKAKAEAERKAAIQAQIAKIERLPVALSAAPAAEIAETIDKLAVDNPEAWAQEFLPLATMTHADVLYTLRNMHAQRVASDAEAKRQAEERQRLAAEAKRLDDAREKMEAERRAQQEKADAEDRERRRKLAEEEAAAQARIREAEEQARRLRQDEEDRIRAERQKLIEEQRAKDEAERRARQAEEDRQRAERLAKEEAERREREAREAQERARLAEENERMDARAALESFVDRFGHLQEFGFVVVAIRSYLEKKAA